MTSEKRKKYKVDFAKAAYKRIPFDLRRDYFENVLKPAAALAGEPINTFIKNAIAMRIKAERLMPESVSKKYYIRSTGYNLIVIYDGTVAKWKQTNEEPSCLSRNFDTSSWDSEEVDNFDEFFGIGNGSEILAEVAF